MEWSLQVNYHYMFGWRDSWAFLRKSIVLLFTCVCFFLYGVCEMRKFDDEGQRAGTVVLYIYI